MALWHWRKAVDCSNVGVHNSTRSGIPIFKYVFREPLDPLDGRLLGSMLRRVKFRFQITYIALGEST